MRRRTGLRRWGGSFGAEERHVYLALNKPPEVVSAMADPEGRKTLRNCLRGLPERVYPVGNLEYAAAGLVFLTNDGDLAAEMLKNWSGLDQVYQVKVKGMLTLADLERLGKEIGVKDENAEAAGRNAWTRDELLVRSHNAGFEKGRDAARANEGASIRWRS